MPIAAPVSRAIIAAALFALPLSARAEPPELVKAFVDSLVKQCGGEMTSALADQVVQRVDLNGDKVDDWVVDASRFPCPKRSAAFADRGVLLTIFLGSADGRAHPALQRAAFGSHLEHRPDTGLSLYVTLGGRDCDSDDPKVRCERSVAWRADQHRIELAPVAPAKLPVPKR